MEQTEQYHHYIPRFLLRNFAIDNYERIFESNINQQKKKSQRKVELIQTYVREEDQLRVSFISKTYGRTNMYKDINNEDAMHVEAKLSKLERSVSETIRNIVKTSQMENQVVLLRKDLEDLRKFIFIMNYRNSQRYFQYANDKFDIPTKLMVTTFMQQHNLQRPAEAGENDEFIITSNGFGIFEGVNGMVFGKFPFQYAYHSFYVISPKLVLVLCPSGFRKEVGTDHLYNHFGHRSIFDNVPHPSATPKYVGTGNKPYNEHNRPKYNGSDLFELRAHLFKMNLNSMGIEMQPNDTFTFPFVKINSVTVHLINSVLLNEVNSDLVLTFLSCSYLYKTIVKYHKNKIVGVQHDFSNLKKKLFTELNRTHKDDLHLRKNIAVDWIYSWNVREMNKNPD
ncbi:3288_t:CDS:2 [Funneliformis mosseae]|uniref:3288_t:CDS:1 n=1 Tax=Funneliformis mosseae TaxID=27381 RepID=A0A9N8W0V0_FUNMO|nr:3288_t:CDS:2 [Funneliformis mosseae]